MKTDFVVIRYGHREVRDYRVTSHCAMVARAFGASKIIICESRDETAEKTLKTIGEKWGGNFKVEYEENWEKAVKELRKKGYLIAHLTMYGLPVQEVEKELENKKVAVIIGSQKVERAVYEKTDYNVSVTTQPHSEIAALAVFLDRVQKGKELYKEFRGAERKIIPEKRGKRVIDLKTLS
jgi:tRNA (cytidine56-2'-O)-methyltransferase